MLEPCYTAHGANTAPCVKFAPRTWFGTASACPSRCHLHPKGGTLASTRAIGSTSFVELQGPGLREPRGPSNLQVNNIQQTATCRAQTEIFDPPSEPQAPTNALKGESRASSRGWKPELRTTADALASALVRSAAWPAALCCNIRLKVAWCSLQDWVRSGFSRTCCLH